MSEIIQGIKGLISGFHKTYRNTSFNYSSSALSPSSVSLLKTAANCISKGNTVLPHLVKLTPMAKNKLLWWVTNLRLYNGELVIKPQGQILIQTDASKKGWGLYVEVSEQGVSDPRRNRIYISVAGTFSHKVCHFAFTKMWNLSTIHIQVDTMTSLSYLLKKGGTKNPELMQISGSFYVGKGSQLFI